MPAIKNSRSKPSNKSSTSSAFPKHSKKSVKPPPRIYESPVSSDEDGSLLKEDAEISGEADEPRDVDFEAVDDVSEKQQRSVEQVGGKVRGRKGKAGGHGKKGKKFLDNKDDLLNLMSSITGSKESIVQSKIARQKAKLPEEVVGGKGVKKELTAAEKKKKERARALRDAKKALVERAKEKKRLAKLVSGGGSQNVENGPVRKRVGFA